jgi:membrane-associated protease RseP (regulator of RpoE activity)
MIDGKGPYYVIVDTGGVTMAEHPVVGLSLDKGGSFADPSLSGNIGGGILKRFVVTFDYGHNTMYLKPVAGPVADLDSYDRAGMWFNVTPEGFKVISVTDGSPAAQAGIRPDDVITAIDGAPVSGLKLPDVRARLRNDAPGTQVKLHLASGKDMTVTLKDQI